MTLPTTVHVKCTEVKRKDALVDINVLIYYPALQVKSLLEYFESIL